MMKNFNLTFLLSLAGACAAFIQVAAGQNWRSGASRNVLVDCPDPAVIQPRETGPVYAFGTGYGIPVFRSDDLYHWDRAGRVFPDDVPAWATAAIPGSRGARAPDIRWFNGRYFLYYAVSTFGSQHSVIGLATNKSLDPASPDYRWQDQGLVLESNVGKTDYNAIDPAMIVDHDKQPYLFWGSFWSGIKAARLDPQTGKLPTGAKITTVAARAPGVDPPAIEAPYVMEHRGYWYLFVSWDKCCDGDRSTYKVVVGRSKSLLGPYVDNHGRRMTDGGGTLVLASYGKWRGPGHNSALSTPHGDWMVNAGYDSDRPSRHRVLQVRPMYWLDDGWPVVGDVVSAPQGPDHSAAVQSALVGDWTQWIDYADQTTVAINGDGRVSSGARSGKWQLPTRRLSLPGPTRPVLTLAPQKPP